MVGLVKGRRELEPAILCRRIAHQNLPWDDVARRWISLEKLTHSQVALSKDFAWKLDTQVTRERNSTNHKRSG